MSGTNRELPAGWEEVTLGGIGEWFGGGTPSKQNPTYWSNGTIPWVSPKDMKTVELEDAIDHITEQAVQESSARLVSGPSIALVMRSGILEHTLPVALVPFEAAFNQDMRVVVPREGVKPRWLLHALLGSAEAIRRSCQKDGTTVASLDSGRLMAYSLLLPPLGEQERIAVRLDEITNQIAAARQSLSRAMESASALTRSVYREALEGGL